jgi:hypothetical protein
MLHTLVIITTPLGLVNAATFLESFSGTQFDAPSFLDIAQLAPAVSPPEMGVIRFPFTNTGVEKEYARRMFERCFQTQEFHPVGRLPML